jgi:hypothetical protein
MELFPEVMPHVFRSIYRGRDDYGKPACCCRCPASTAMLVVSSVDPGALPAYDPSRSESLILENFARLQFARRDRVR